jgi:hypothetical protein
MFVSGIIGKCGFVLATVDQTDVEVTGSEQALDDVSDADLVAGSDPWSTIGHQQDPGCTR